MKQKEALEDELERISKKINERKREKLEKLERTQLDADFSDVSGREKREKLARLELEVETDEEYQRLENLSEKMGKAYDLINGGIGPREPDEEFVPEPSEVTDKDAMNQFLNRLKDIDTEKTASLEEEVEKLEEALKEFFSHAE